MKNKFLTQKIAGFEIFQLLIETRKATGFMSLRGNFWEISQITKKFLKYKSEHHHRVFHIRNNLDTKFSLN